MTSKGVDGSNVAGLVMLFEGEGCKYLSFEEDEGTYEHLSHV